MSSIAIFFTVKRPSRAHIEAQLILPTARLASFACNDAFTNSAITPAANSFLKKHSKSFKKLISS